MVVSRIVFISTSGLEEISLTLLTSALSSSLLFFDREAFHRHPSELFAIDTDLGAPQLVWAGHLAFLIEI
jgi:hypothetical protein